jgi:transketolase
MAAANPLLIASNGDSLREAFGKALTELAPSHPNVVVLDADIAGGTGVHHFRKAFPDRFFQFGIAEQNMMAAAGGMAATGLIPVVTTFAVFCLREDVGGDEGRMAGFVGKDEYFARSRQQVDGNDAKCLPLGLDDIAVTRAEDLRDGTNRLGAEGERGDGL